MAGTIIATIGIDLWALLFGGVDTDVPFAIADEDGLEEVGAILDLLVEVADRVEDVVGPMLLSTLPQLLVSTVSELSVVCGMGRLVVLVDNVARVAATDGRYVGYAKSVSVFLIGDSFSG